jgi:hypothetical protein
MRTVRLLVCFLAVAILASIAVRADESHSPKKITIIGKLTRVMAVGGESTGWSLELKREITLEGQKMNAIEVAGPMEKFEKLADQRVRARGTLTHRKGVERGERLILEVTSINAAK